MTDFVWGDADTIWAGYRSGAFVQHDVHHSYSPLDTISRHAVTWDPLGGVAFVTGRKTLGEIPFDDM